MAVFTSTGMNFEIDERSRLVSLVPKHIKKLLQFLYCLLIGPNQIFRLDANKEKPFSKSLKRKKLLKNALPELYGALFRV